MTEAEVTEALSRAVIGGLVQYWREGRGYGRDRTPVYNVTTNDGRQHRYTPGEAAAFAEAVFAAEKIARPPTPECGDTIYARVGSTAIAFRITSVDRGELRAEAVREQTGG